MTTGYNGFTIINNFNTKLSRFCGWVDVGLSLVGEKEAERSALAIKRSGLDISKIYTSLLTRAWLTVEVILKVSGGKSERTGQSLSSP